MIDNKIKYGNSKRIQTISQVVIIIIVIALLFIMQGMLSGLETKTLSSSTKTYENIVLDSSTDFSGKHYPYTLDRNNVYEPLVDKNMNSGALREIRYIAEDQKPYATVETKVTKQFYRNSKYPLTNIGRSLVNFMTSLKNERCSWKSVTVHQLYKTRQSRAVGFYISDSIDGFYSHMKRCMNNITLAFFKMIFSSS